MFVIFVMGCIVVLVGWFIKYSLDALPWRKMSIGFKLLWLSGIFYLPGGLVWVAKWDPSPGPYWVGEAYPFGTYIQAWEVSMGFAFIGFGLLFCSTVLLLERMRQRFLWKGMLLSWLLLMLPHFLIGVTFALDDPSLQSLGVARYSIPNTLAWMAMMVAGFAYTHQEMRA